MNPDRPTDPREQLEVRITALLLGEASAFEEAELLEAIKADPQLGAYYEEMRRMVKTVEEAIQLAPAVAPTTQPRLAEERRGKLAELFKQPAPAKTIKLDAPAGRARRLGWLQHAAAIAAAMVILLAVVGMLLPAFSKAKSKTSLISSLMPQVPIIDQLGGSQASFDYMIEGRSTNIALSRQSAEFVQQSYVESRPQLGSAVATPESAVLDERFLARFGSSRAQTKSPAEAAALTTPKPVEAVRKPADIYLPSASTDTAGVPVRSFATDVSRGLATDNSARYYFRDSGITVNEAVPGKVAAVEVDSPQLAYALPNPSAVQPRPAAVPLALATVEPRAAMDSMTLKADDALKSEVVLGKKLASPAAPAPAKSEAEELRPSVFLDRAIPPSESERRFRGLDDIEARGGDIENAAAQAGSVRGRAGGGADVAGQPVAPLAALENQADAANTWHADFGAMAAAPAVESFGRGVVVDDFVSNGQVAPELFAKQQADTKSGERLERLGQETSLGLAVEEAKVPVVPMYAEQLLTEQRPFDRERVEELSKQITDQAGRGLAQVRRRAKLIDADGEDKRLKELGDRVSARGEMTTEQLEREAVRLKREALVQLGVADYDETTLRNELFSLLREHQRSEDKIRLNEHPAATFDTQSRFDTLADHSSSEFGLATVNGREQQVSQQLESTTVAAPEVTQLAEQVVEAQPTTLPPPSLEPLPEIRTADNAFSTFSLNVSDVSFQLAASSLENGQMPDGARLRSEEFINAFDYRDPAPAPGQRVAFNWERARNPFAHNRELLRLSVQTAAAGREPGQPLNLVLLLDNSGSMERADRVRITEQMLRVLAAGLNDYDRISVISFARTPRLIVDGLPGGNHQALLDQITGLNPDGGTNLEDALKLGYETAAKHFHANGNNRVILITDGAANLGNVEPAQLRERVIDQRKRGIALDCFGVGWEGYNDNLLESLSRNGDGRYGFLNDAGNAVFEFSKQLAGALQVAAADVKAQVEFNPDRVTVYRQIGYQQHQLTKEQFRDNTVDAAEIGAAEAGNALYSVEVNPNGSGPIGTFRARYHVPSTGQYEEKEWVLEYTPVAPELGKSGPAMRLASSSAAFAEWLANSPYAQSVTPDALQNLLRDVPDSFAPDPRPAKLQAMIQQARAISGR